MSVEGYVDESGTVELGFQAEQGVTWIGIDRACLEYLGKTYSRSVTSGDYGTICLPYEVDLASVSGVEKVYKLSSMTSDVATLTQVEAMEAGKPYIFKSNAAEVVMPAKVGGNVVGTPQEDEFLVGTFSDIEELTEGTYVLSGNKFYLVDSPVKCAAYRCYFKDLTLTSGVKNFGFVEDGGEGAVRFEHIAECPLSETCLLEVFVKFVFHLSGRKLRRCAHQHVVACESDCGACVFPCAGDVLGKDIKLVRDSLHGLFDIVLVQEVFQ